MTPEQKRLFAQCLGIYGTDFTYITGLPEFKDVRAADLLEEYRRHLQELAVHTRPCGTESSITMINKIFRDDAFLKAQVELGEGGVRSTVLGMDDDRLPFLLKDREYFLKQQLAYVYELYRMLLEKGMIDKGFIGAMDDVGAISDKGTDVIGKAKDNKVEDSKVESTKNKHNKGVVVINENEDSKHESIKNESNKIENNKSNTINSNTKDNSIKINDTRNTNDSAVKEAGTLNSIKKIFNGLLSRQDSGPANEKAAAAGTDSLESQSVSGRTSSEPSAAPSKSAEREASSLKNAARSQLKINNKKIKLDEENKMNVEAAECAKEDVFEEENLISNYLEKSRF